MKKAFFIAIIAIVLFAAWYFLWYKPGQDNSLTGACKTIGGLPGSYQNGVCTPLTPTALTLPCGGRINPC